MIRDSLIEVEIVGSTARWYREKGYNIPMQEVQLWATYNGKKIKNGIKKRVIKGTKIFVKPEDLSPSSNEKLFFICETCGIEFTTTWGAHGNKQSNNCRSCQAKKGFKGGCQDYWVDYFIINNPNAACDISGETDKRFLELHHLLSRSVGGKNELNNYVVLSANYHRAFHKSLGGTSVPCYPEQYYEFKRLELGEKLKIA